MNVLKRITNNTKSKFKRNLFTYSLIYLFTLVLILSMPSANAESLFVLGASQNYQGTPRSLFGGVQAHQIGDLISIRMAENVSVSDNLTYSSAKESNTTDAFTSFLKEWFHLSFLKDTGGYGGSNEVSNSANGQRALSMGDRIACQVVQQLPNGNLAVQGKKTLVNGNERVDFIVTGVVDPRWLNVDGEIYSYNVSNLQFALSGRGSVSRSQNEGVFNRFIRYLF